MRYLKKASRSAGGEDAEVTAAVAKILRDVESGGEDAARDYAVRFDHWEGDIVVAAADRERAASSLPQYLKDDIAFAHLKPGQIEIIGAPWQGHGGYSAESKQRYNEAMKRFLDGKPPIVKPSK